MDSSAYVNVHTNSFLMQYLEFCVHSPIKFGLFKLAQANALSHKKHNFNLVTFLKAKLLKKSILLSFLSSELLAEPSSVYPRQSYDGVREKLGVNVKADGSGEKPRGVLAFI